MSNIRISQSQSLAFHCVVCVKKQGNRLNAKKDAKRTQRAEDVASKAVKIHVFDYPTLI